MSKKDAAIKLAKEIIENGQKYHLPGKKRIRIDACDLPIKLNVIQ